MAGEFEDPPADRPETNGMAIGSLVTGICGLACVLPFIGSLLGVVLGHLSLSEIKRSEGRYTGRELAVWGLVTGYIGLVAVPFLCVLFFIAIMVLPAATMMLPAMWQARGAAKQAVCAGNMKQMGLALLMYSGDNKGCFPTTMPNGSADFSILADEGYISPSGQVWACANAAPMGVSASNSEYIYVGSGLKDDNASAATVVLAYDAPGNHSGNAWINAVFADGHVEGTRGPDIESAAAMKGWTLPGSPPARGTGPPPELPFNGGNTR